MKGKVFIALNTAWNLANFRAGLIRALISEGYEVVAAAPPDRHVPRLVDLGCRFVPLPMDNKGTNPGKDLVLLWRFLRLLRQERPAVFLGYTIKPNIYGSLAAHLTGVPVINNVAGLGTAFIARNWLTRLVRLLYRLALSRSTLVFFQNEADRQLFVDGGIVRQEATDRLPGSGVNLKRFSMDASDVPLQSRSVGETGDRFRFMLVARMLWDKGVGEYVEAARIVRSRYPYAEFCLLGFLDVQNPSAISRSRMDEWVARGIVNYLGETDDVRLSLAHADCVVLPSYREGVPRTLLEAAAMGRPLIATDVAGCRDVVDDGVNGYLCRPQDSLDLAEKMERMLLLSDEQRALMGAKGREKVEREFDEEVVIRRYLEMISRVVDK